MSLRTRNALIFLSLTLALVGVVLGVRAHMRLDWNARHCSCDPATR